MDLDDDPNFNFNLLVDTSCNVLKLPKEMEIPLTEKALHEAMRFHARRPVEQRRHRLVIRCRGKSILQQSNLDQSASMDVPAGVEPRPTAMEIPAAGAEPWPAGMEIPASVRELIGGEAVAVVVVEKRLSKTDVTLNNNRLSLPGKAPQAVLNSFLGADERRRVMKREGLEVSVMGENGIWYIIALKRWLVGKTAVYNLATAAGTTWLRATSSTRTTSLASTPSVAVTSPAS